MVTMTIKSKIVAAWLELLILCISIRTEDKIGCVHREMYSQIQLGKKVESDLNVLLSSFLSLFYPNHVRLQHPLDLIPETEEKDIKEDKDPTHVQKSPPLPSRLPPHLIQLPQ